MQVNDYQKYLKYASVVNLVGGGLLCGLGLLTTIGGALVGHIDPAFVAETASEIADASVALGGTGVLVAGMGLIALIAGGFNVIEGFLGIRASKDAAAVKPVWWVSLIALVLSGMSFISTLAVGMVGFTELLGLAVCGVTFWAANGIAQETAAPKAIAA